MSEHLTAIVESVTRCRDLYAKSPLLKGSEGIANLLLATLSYVGLLEARISLLELNKEMGSSSPVPGEKH